MKTTRKLPVQLTDEELQQRAAALAENIEKTAALKEEKKAQTAEITGKIKLRDEMTRRLSRTIASRTEDREVECEMLRDFDRGVVTITRTDTGEVVDERPMTADERQESMWQQSEPRTPVKGKGKKLPGMDGEDETGEPA